MSYGMNGWNKPSGDLISRAAAIDACLKLSEARRKWDTAEGRAEMRGIDAVMCAIHDLPSAQPEHLRDDDFEAIRIHLNAYKERLCNQHRWEEAEEYQRIINRFMSFVSAQPEIVRCKDCEHNRLPATSANADCEIFYGMTDQNGFCHKAERREVNE